MSDLKRKIRQYQRLKRLIPTLEAEIKATAAPLLRAEGNLAIPRIERIIAQFGG